jgi:hypothetical protein
MGVGEADTMADEQVKRAAQEYLAERLSEEGLTYEQTLNRDAAIKHSLDVWKKAADTIHVMVNQWNAETKEKTLYLQGNRPG